MSSSLARGLAAPCFGLDPGPLIDLAVQAEDAGFDGFFLWDHMVFANDGDGPDIFDPWLLLAVIAARTQRIKIGTMITPVSRRRPWVLARQTATLDVLSGGRVIIGTGIGSPAHGDFAIFGDESDAKIRAELLDEGLAVLDGLWSGDRFSFSGSHFQIAPVRFTPTPVQRPRIPVWVGGTLPLRRPMRRAAAWDGAVPIRWLDRELVRPTVEDISWVCERVLEDRGHLDDFDVAVWAEVADAPASLGDDLAAYQAAGATWWIETAHPQGDWLDGLRRRIDLGVQ